MGADALPGGGRKPRTATPLAWRLIILGVSCLLLWSLYSTSTSYRNLAHQVQTLVEEQKATKAELDRVQAAVRGLDARTLSTTLAESLEGAVSAKLLSKVDEMEGRLGGKADEAGKQEVRQGGGPAGPLR